MKSYLLADLTDVSQLHFETVIYKHPEYRYNFTKIETSITSYNINNEKTNTTGLNGRINEVKW